MYLLIFGPPGAGKGTQAQRISERLSIPHISTGDIFRENIRNNTPLGLEARRYTDSGNLVPDSVTNAMVKSRLHDEDCSGGFLLDGYPRTIEQAQELEQILGELGYELNAVVNLEVTDGELIQRLSKRGRKDDSPETIRRRLQVYHETTSPVKDFYYGQGKLVNVHGIGDIQEITETIIQRINGVTSDAGA